MWKMFTDLENQLKELLAAYPSVLTIDLQVGCAGVWYKLNFVKNVPGKEFLSILEMLEYLDTL